MIFKPSDAIEIPIREGSKRIDKESLGDFWKEFQEKTGLSLHHGIGCYIFSIKTRGGEKPWYVGKAEKQSFEKECFSPDKLLKYNEILDSKEIGKSRLTLIVKYTPTDRLSKPSPSPKSDIQYLEEKLITQCLQRNKDLINVKNTKLEKEMVVEGLMNTPRGRGKAKEVQIFKKLVGTQ